MDAGMKEDVIVKVEAQRGKRSEVLEELGIARSTYYKWRRAYREQGVFGLAKAEGSGFRIWNRLTPSEVEGILEIARLHPEL